MHNVVLLLVALLMPTAAGGAVLGARRLHLAYLDSRPALPSTRPLDRIRADLRRLHDLLDETENASSELPAKNHRCRATRAAYLDALTAACTQLHVPVPAGHPVPRAEIYRVEDDLRRVGVDVRPVGS